MKTQTLCVAKLTMLTAFTAFAFSLLHAQTNTFPSSGAAGIGTTSPNTSSLLEIRSTAKGFLAPRMTQAQRDAIGSPATGLLIYQTNNTPGFYYYGGSAWKAVTPAATANAWSLTGNAGTTAANYLGTSDNKDFVLKTNSTARLTINKTGNVGIGTSVPGSLLDVHNGALTISNTNSSANLVISANSSNANASNQILFQDNALTKWALGGAHIGSAGSNDFSLYNYNTGVNVMTVLNGNSNVGIGTISPTSKLHVEDGTNGVAIHGNCNGNSFGGNTVGVYGTSPNGTGVLGFGGDWAGYFDGDVFCTANYQGSDRRLKQNIVDFGSAISIISQLRPKQYEYKQDGPYKFMGLPQGEHYGLIAQDIEQVLPNVVKETRFDTRLAQPLAKEGQPASQHSEVVKFKAVNYTELIPILVKAVQELNEKNDNLQKQIDDLRAMMASGNTNNTSSKTSAFTTLTDASLDQNNPNPFSNTTTIGYTLPQKFTAAQITITDKNGKILKQTTVSGGGKGTIHIDAAMLAAGAYNYSLLVDGKLIGTKQMLLSK